MLIFHCPFFGFLFFLNSFALFCCFHYVVGVGPSMTRKEGDGFVISFSVGPSVYELCFSAPTVDLYSFVVY